MTTPPPADSENNVVELAEVQSQKATEPSKILVGDIHNRGRLRPEFVASVRRLEQIIGKPVWLLIHGDEEDQLSAEAPMEGITLPLVSALLSKRRKLPNEPIAVLIDSPGGDAEAAYRLALAFRKVCNGFEIYIPRWAKSAATLMALGADRIVLGPHAELGPLDVQHKESRRKDYQSALNEIKAIDRLHNQSLRAFDQTMAVLINRLGLTGEELDEFIPMAFDFVAKQFRSLFEKVDAVHWTKVSRMLRIGQEYAKRLLERDYGEENAEIIANQLVEGYPDHAFDIEIIEANRIGLEIESPDDALSDVFEDLFDCLNHRDSFSVVGFITEIAAPGSEEN